VHQFSGLVLVLPHLLCEFIELVGLSGISHIRDYMRLVELDWVSGLRTSWA